MLLSKVGAASGKRFWYEHSPLSNTRIKQEGKSVGHYGQGERGLISDFGKILGFANGKLEERNPIVSRVAPY